MYKILLPLLLIFFTNGISAQEFKFQMYFTDAVGNKDSIALGYDNNATDSIDAAFGEVNIIAHPLDTGLDVRITNEWSSRSFSSTPGTYHTKVQIVNYDQQNVSRQTIDIKTNHWPVTASWDSSLFSVPRRNGSVFTGSNPGDWWDVVGPGQVYQPLLGKISQVTFSANIDDYRPENYAYVNNDNDTIPVYWFAFADSTLILGQPEEIFSHVNIYPNPATDEADIEGLPGNAPSTIQITTITGKDLATISSESQNRVRINTSTLAAGIYLVKLTSGEHYAVKKLMVVRK